MLWFLLLIVVVIGGVGCLVLLLAARPQDEPLSDEWRRAHVGTQGDGGER